MKTLSIYQYESARQFLKDWITVHQQSSAGFSLRKWAAKTPFSHTLVILMIQGKRSLKARHASPLADAMELSPPEKTYFQTLIEFENARSPEQREIVARWLRELNPGQPFTFKEIEEYRLYANWEHMAILSLLQTTPAPKNSEEVFARISGARPNSMDESIWRKRIDDSWKRLIELGLIHRMESGGFGVAYTYVSSRNDIASQGAREHYRQILDLAKDAIEKQAIDEREFQIFSLPIRRDDLTEIKEELRSFRERLARKYGSRRGANTVYQFNLNSFRLTERSTEMNPRIRVRNEDEGAAETSIHSPTLETL